MKTRVLLPRALALLVLSFAIMVQPQSAKAQFSIQSPVVEKGEVEIENHSSFQFGLPRGDESPSQQGHELSVGYGFTDFWKSELSLTLDKTRGDGLEATEVEIENTFQLATFKPWDATFGLFASVAFGVGGGEPDAFELGPMVQFGGEERSLILNAFFEKSFGDNREDGIGFEYAAQLKSAIGHGISIGAEAFGAIENIEDVPSFNETELRVGPAIFFTLGDDKDDAGKKGKDDDDDKPGMKDADKDPEVEIGIGVLFGATDATPDVTLKWDVEVNF